MEKTKASSVKSQDRSNHSHAKKRSHDSIRTPQVKTFAHPIKQQPYYIVVRTVAGPRILSRGLSSKHFIFEP